jgi:hypothetical protein
MLKALEWGHRNHVLAPIKATICPHKKANCFAQKS